MDALKQALGLDLPTSLRGMTLASLGMLALALIAIPMVWLFGGSEKIMGLCIAVSMLFVMAIFVTTAIYLGRMQAGRMRQMLAGDYWARWNYTDEEGQQFSQHEIARTYKDMRFSFFFSIVLGLVVGALMAFLTHSPVIGLLTGGFAFALGIALVMQDAGRGKAYVFPGPGVDEIYIGDQGVYQPGKFCSFDYLIDVVLEGDNPPQTLLFYIVTSAYSYLSLSTRSLQTAHNTAPVRVGVPYGREADAKQLVERFRARLFPESAA